MAGALGVGALLGLAPGAEAAHGRPGPKPGRGNRPRLLVSTDIGGTDFDDFQSMVHLLLYSDVLQIEGLLSSPYGGGTKEALLGVVDVYEKDYPQLRRHSPHYPTPRALRAVTKKGASATAPSRGYASSTEGSRWIVECARRRDKRPLDILVWGGIDDLAQALHDAPDIIDRIRVWFIGGPNKLWSVDAYNYIETRHPSLWMIESNATYRGFFTGGDQTGEWGDTEFVSRHVAGHGALGDYFTSISPQVKMGDTPAVTWYLHGSQNPERPSWGGRYVPVWDGRKSVFERLTTAADVGEVYGVIEIVLPTPAGWRRSDTASMTIGGRTNGPFPEGVREGDSLRFRFSPRDPKVWDYVIHSSHPDLDGASGAVTAAPPAASRVARGSRVHRRWWSDDQDPAFAEGVWVGAKHVSQWRHAYLSDFAERLDRCLPKHGCP